MLAQEEYVEVHALRRRGWSISAIARHLGRDRKTVRAYLSGERMPGERALGEGETGLGEVEGDGDPDSPPGRGNSGQPNPSVARHLNHRC